ncbi:hypothetical protein [Streptomyces mirabilis]|uniref:hypothetical protein n=1 Tax=Streptomyces mirabilis TaxID=68239 RepID=UPI00380C483C
MLIVDIDVLLVEQVLCVGGVPVQHRGGQVLAERHPREAPVRGQLVYQRPSILSK